MNRPLTTPSRSAAGEPTWEIAHLFPQQGTWSEEDYLALNTNHLIEFSDGYLEVLPMPKTLHQLIVLFLYRALYAFVDKKHLGEVVVAPLRVRLRRGKYREPDVVFMSRDHGDRIGEDYWEGADLVMEVVSEDDPERDWKKKRTEYAKAGIPEYWIVDPQRGSITVLRLKAGRYVKHGEFPRGTRASSCLLRGFEVNVSAALAGR